jgi:16S rRNA (uracil1498-N3)-methyltransferase
VEAVPSLQDAVERCNGEGLRIILWEKEGEPLREILKNHPSRNVFAMVGPEGGFTESEVAWVKERGFTPVKLGQRILRTETAAITLVGILQYELGDLGSPRQP